MVYFVITHETIMNLLKLLGSCLILTNYNEHLEVEREKFLKK